MNFFRKPLVQAVAVAALAFSAQAGAAQLGIDFTSPYPTADGQSTITDTNIPLTLTDTTTGATGLLKDSLTTLLAYCFQPFVAQSPDLVGGTLNYAAGAVSTNATLVQKLFDKYYTDTLGAYDQASFQLALWELASETTSSLDVKTGTFQATATKVSGTVDLNVLDSANGMLGALAGWTDNNKYTVTEWQFTGTDSHGDPSQAFVTASLNAQVPEPATDLLAALGVLGLIVARRKRAA